jgi:hypothetical protein
MLTGKAGERAAFSWAKDWKQVEHGLFAGALDNRWANGLSAEEIGGDPLATVLTQQAATLVGGVDWSDGLIVKGFFGCKEDGAASRAMQAIQGGLREGRALLHKEGRTPSPPGSVGQVAAKLVKDLLDNAKVTRRDNTACASTHATLSVADMAKLLLERMPQKR